MTPVGSCNLGCTKITAPKPMPNRRHAYHGENHVELRIKKIVISLWIFMILLGMYILISDGDRIGNMVPSYVILLLFLMFAIALLQPIITYRVLLNDRGIHVKWVLGAKKCKYLYRRKASWESVKELSVLNIGLKPMVLNSIIIHCVGDVENVSFALNNMLVDFRCGAKYVLENAKTKKIDSRIIDSYYNYTSRSD